MPEVDKAVVGTAGIVGGGALVVSMLGAEAPLTSLPQGAFFDHMPRLVSAAPKAVGELGLGPMLPLAQDSAALQVILSWLYIGWPLSGKDAWDTLVARGEEGSHGRRRGAGDKEVLLEAGTDGTRHEVSLHCE